jgi:hypothetical protein
VLFDGFEIAALVGALRLDGAASKRPLASGFGQSAQSAFGSLTTTRNMLLRSPLTNWWPDLRKCS